MRILSIGIYGIPDEESCDFSEADVLQDYDAIVIRPDSIETLFGGYNINYKDRQKLILDREQTLFLFFQSLKRQKELHGLLKKGGIAVVLMSPVLYYSREERISLNNYDWLLSREELNDQLNITHGTGKTIDYLQKNHSFYEYLKTKPTWNSYCLINTVIKHEWNILASAYGTHAVSLEKQINNGCIIFIPYFYSSDNGPMIHDCIQSIFEKGTPSLKPDWINGIIFPGQEELYPKIREINQSIEKQKSEAEQTNNKIEELDKWKYL